MNPHPRPRLATLLLLACFVSLVNHLIMRLGGAPSTTTSRGGVEVSNTNAQHSNNRPKIPAIPLQQVLPTCESLMNSPNSALADGAFLTRETTINTWTHRTDGSRELNLPFTCRLKRYTSSEARQCLSNKHLAFVGDSLTRYQYLSLAYLIERGQYPPRFSPSDNCTHMDDDGQPTCSPQGEPNVCNEADWADAAQEDSWKDFHSAIGGGTDGGIFHGRMECSCARRYRDMNISTENYLYVSSEGKEHVGGGGGRVIMSVVNEIGWDDDPNPIHGWNFTRCSFEGTCRTTNGVAQVIA